MGHGRASTVGLTIAALLLAGAAQAQTQAPAASVRTRASTTIAAGVAITTRQDFVLGGVLLGLARTTRSLTLNGTGFERLRDALAPAGTAPPVSAAFVVNGDAGRSISIAIPPAIDLTRLGGSQTIRMATRTDYGGVVATQTLALLAHGDGGLLAFNVGGRLLLDADAVAGDYRGTLAATAQYN